MMPNPQSEKPVTAAASPLRNTSRYPVRLLLLALAGFLFVYPVAMLVLSIFRTTRPGVAGEWTLEKLSAVIASPATWAALQNSLVFSIASTVLATAIAILLAFLVTRTNVPMRRIVTPVMVLIFAAPNMLYVVSWALLADPIGGVLNQALASVGFGPSVFNIYSWAGLILVQGLKISAFCYLLLLPAFENMNRSFEEASLVAGASRLQTVFRIDVPVLLPAITGVMMLGTVFGLGAFDIPQILGGLAGVPVLSTEIYKKLNFSFPPDYPGASALSLFMMAALAIMLFVQARVIGKGDFATVTGKSFRNDRWNIGRWRVAGAIVIGVFVLIALLLPGGQLVLTSFQPSVGVYDFTLRNYEVVLSDAQTARAFRLTAVVAVLGGLVAMALATLFGFVGRHSPRWVARAFDAALIIPIAMPGVVLAVGLLWAYISIPFLRPLYGSFWFAFIGLVILVMPIASRAVQAALAQIARDLEEAASVSGAGPARVLLDIVLKLMQGSFFAGWLVAAVIAAGTLDIPLMLLPPSTPNVAVLAYSYINSALMTQTSAILVLLLASVAVLGALGALLIAFFRTRKPATA